MISGHCDFQSGMLQAVKSSSLKVSCTGTTSPMYWITRERLRLSHMTSHLPLISPTPAWTNWQSYWGTGLVDLSQYACWKFSHTVVKDQLLIILSGFIKNTHSVTVRVYLCQIGLYDYFYFRFIAVNDTVWSKQDCFTPAYVKPDFLRC